MLNANTVNDVIITTVDESYAALANAIIASAARDYEKVLRKIVKLSKKTDKESVYKLKVLVGEKKKIEKFFYSEWYGQLSNSDPDYILEQIQNNVAQAA